MTVANTLRRAGPYTCNGATTAFPFTFKVFAETDLLVVEFDIASEVETYKAINIDFTVSLNGDQNVSPGGDVVAASAPPTGKKWTLLSAVPALQDTDLVGGGGFYPETIEDAMDRAVALIQQLQELQSRSMLLPVSFNLVGLLPAPKAFYLLGWNEAETQLVNYAPGVGSVSVVNAYQANQYSVPYVLTPGASVAVPAPQSNNFTLLAGQNFTLENPVGLEDGMVLNFRIKQDISGSRVASWGSKYKFAGGVAGVLTTTPSGVDFMSCYYDGPSDTLDCVLNVDFK